MILSIATRFSIHDLNPETWQQNSSIQSWLHDCRLRVSAQQRKGGQSLIMLAAWEIRLERNKRIFHQEELSVEHLVGRIRDEAVIWNLAGASIPFDSG